jgi:hypothetical protein
MNFRPTKITKFFPNESPGSYRFFPSPMKKDIPEQEQNVVSNVVPKVSISSFDHFPIALATHYTSAKSTIDYCLYFSNLNSKTILNKLDHIEDPILGELLALQECLQYIVYYPLLFQKINKQRLIIYTNSKQMINLFKPDSEFLNNNEYSKLYFKLQDLVKCIKHISIEYQTENQYPISHANKILSINHTI